MKRRAFLGTAAAAGLTGLAGCGRPAHLTRPPNVPEQRLRDNGWERLNAFTEKLFERSIEQRTVVADAHTVRYANEALRERVDDRTFGQVDAPFGRFFAKRVRFDPKLPSLSEPAQDKVLKHTRAEAEAFFRRWLKDEGLTDVTQVGTGSMTVATGETASRRDFTGKMPLEDIPITMPRSDSVTIDLNSVTVKGYLAVWRHGDEILVSGGTHPAENADEVTTERIAPGITVSVQVDLGFEPATYRAELLSLMKQVR